MSKGAFQESMENSLIFCTTLGASTLIFHMPLVLANRQKSLQNMPPETFNFGMGWQLPQIFPDRISFTKGGARVIIFELG